MSYVKSIKKLLFGEKKDKCSVAFVGSRVNTESSNKIELGCILVCNENGIVSSSDTNSDRSGNKYYFFPNLKLEKDEIQPITKDEIENMIKNKDIVGIKQLRRY